MLWGGLGQPDGGWPTDIQKVVLGDREPTTKRPGELAEPIDLDTTRSTLASQLGRPVTVSYTHLTLPTKRIV